MPARRAVRVRIPLVVALSIALATGGLGLSAAQGKVGLPAAPSLPAPAAPSVPPVTAPVPSPPPVSKPELPPQSQAPPKPAPPAPPKPAPQAPPKVPPKGVPQVPQGPPKGVPQVPPKGASQAPPKGVPSSPASVPSEVRGATPDRGSVAPGARGNAAKGSYGDAAAGIAAESGRGAGSASSSPADGVSPKGSAAPIPAGPTASVGQAQAAPPKSFVAYVWSAVALTPIQRYLSTLKSELPAAEMTAPELSSLLSLVSPLSVASQIADLDAGAAFPGPAGASKQQPEQGPGIFPTSGAAISLLLALLVSGGLLAALVFALRRELGPRRRWRLRRSHLNSG